MQQVLEPIKVSDKRIKQLVQEQFPDLTYLLEKPKKRLSLQEQSYRKFLKEQMMKNLVIS